MQEGDTTSRPTTTGLLDIPIELLAEIFSNIQADHLYPSCFLINKQCLRAILDEEIWHRRCVNDLQVTELISGGSWKDTYREYGSALWDANTRTLPDEIRSDHSGNSVASGLILEGSEANFVVEKNIARRDGGDFGYASVRTKKAYRSGRHSFEWTILSMTACDFCVGFVGSNWDCRNNVYTHSKDKSYCYWSCGSAYDVSAQVNSATVLEKDRWSTNSVVGATLDLDKCEVYWYHDGSYQYTLTLHREIVEHSGLWPVVCFYSPGERVSLKKRHEHFPPPTSRSA